MATSTTATASATATITRPGDPARPAETLPLHRLDVDTYNAIVDSGALEGQHVELLDGVLVEMSPQSPAHFLVIMRLTRHFAAVERWWTGVQGPLEVDPDSAPEPDVAVYAQEPPAGQHPRTAEVAIEVAVSSQLIDRNVKGPKYARAGILAYWLIDVPARTVEVYTEPGEQGYARCERYDANSMLPCHLEDVADIDLAALFEGIES